MSVKEGASAFARLWMGLPPSFFFFFFFFLGVGMIQDMYGGLQKRPACGMVWHGIAFVEEAEAEAERRKKEDRGS